MASQSMKSIAIAWVFAAILSGQAVDEKLLFSPLVADLGRYLANGRPEFLERWNPTDIAIAQLNRRATRGPWSETTPPIFKLIRVVAVTPTYAVLLAEESTFSSVMLRERTPVRIRLTKTAQGRWVLAAYETPSTSAYPR